MSKKKAFDRDSISNTLIVAIGLSLVCSIIVASTAIVLKPVQERNEELFRQKIILDVAVGFHQAGHVEDDLLPEQLLVSLLHGLQNDRRTRYDDRTDQAEADGNDQRVRNAVAVKLFLIRHFVSASALHWPGSRSDR